MTTEREKRLQAKVKGLQRMLAEVRKTVGLPMNASHETLMNLLKGKLEQGAETNVDVQKLQLWKRAVCVALKLPETAEIKDVTDALVQLSDYGLAGKMLAEAVSQAWMGKPVEQITTKELVSNLLALQRFRDKLNVLFDVQKPVTYDELYAKVETAVKSVGCDECSAESDGLCTLMEPPQPTGNKRCPEYVPRSAPSGTYLSEKLCDVLSLPEGTQIPTILATVKGLYETKTPQLSGAYLATQLCIVLSLPAGTSVPVIIAAVKGLREREERAFENDPTLQAMNEMRKQLELEPGAHPAVVASNVNDLLEQLTTLDELRVVLQLSADDPDARILETGQQIIATSRANCEAADAADRELTEMQTRLEQVEQELRAATFSVTKIAALGSVLGTLCDNALARGGRSGT